MLLHDLKVLIELYEKAAEDGQVTFDELRQMFLQIGIVLSVCIKFYLFITGGKLGESKEEEV
jgi:hypothetical protein